jgi:PAS domain S-box-containing protein
MSLSAAAAEQVGRKRPRESSLSAQIILLSLSAAMFAWVMSAFLDFYLHYWDRTFPELLLTNVPPREVYSRVAISIAFMISGAVASSMVRRLDEAEQHASGLNESLRAIRSVNQLITRERDLTELARGVCKRLVELRGYRWAEVTLEGRWTLDVELFHPEDECRAEVATIEIPLRCADDVRGELAVTLPVALASDIDEREFLGEVAEDLAFALRSVAIEEERERREAMQRTLYQVSSGLNSPTTGGDLQAVAQYGLAGVLKASCIKVTEYDPDTDRIMPWGFRCGVGAPDPSVPAAGTLAGCVGRTGIVLLVDGPQMCRMAGEGVIEAQACPPAVWAGVPIQVGGRTRAVLSAEHAIDAKCLGHDEVELLMFVAEQLGASIERGRADHQIREQREQLQTILDSVPAYIFYKDASCRYLSVNRALAERTGIPKENWVGRKMEEVLPATREGASWRDAEVVRTGKASIGDIEVLELEGEMRWLETDRIPYCDPNGRIVGIIGLSIDVTDHRKAEAALAVKEEELRQSQKMEAVGLLAGGIAHDFNNLLTAISGYAELSLSQASPGDPVAENLRGIQAAAARAAALTRQLLAFSRRQPLQLVATDLAALADGARKLLDRLIGEDVELVIEVDKDVPGVCVDPGQIEQVIVNLAVNARDAMPEGGRLTISVERAVRGGAACDGESRDRRGTFAKITVADTGVGMPRDVMQHIFEPFFTTKGPHAGTGLGLSVVDGIIDQHGGWIDVGSEPGEGTVFSVFLPEAAERHEPTKPKIPARACLSGGDGRQILLVEDEELVRRLAAVALRRSGYGVVEATTAEEALALLGESEEFTLVFSDVVLPGMSGVKLADAVLAQHPGLRVLLCSGYTDGKSQWPLIQERKFNFLDKPYTIDGLLDAVRHAIEETPPARIPHAA